MFVLFVAFHSHKAIEHSSEMFVGEDVNALRDLAKKWLVINVRKCVHVSVSEYLKELIEQDADYYDIVDAIGENSDVVIMGELYDPTKNL